MSAAPDDRVTGTPANGRRWWALGFVLVANVSVFAAVTMMNVALPDAQADLDLSDGARRSVVTLYSLGLGSLLLVGGRVADVVGLRRCMVLGLGAFAATSLLGGAATSAEVLLVSRALQGASGAMVAATALGLLSVLFPQGSERRRAFAVLGSVMGLGTAGSFLVAGALVQLGSWRWCLLVNVPLAVLAAVGILLTSARDAGSSRGRVDGRGAVLVVAALSCSVVGLDRAGARGWDSLSTALVVAGALLSAGFVVSSTRSRDPLVPLHVVSDRARAVALVAVFSVGIGIFAALYVLSTYLVDVRGHSPLVVGLAFVPMGLSAMATSAVMVSCGGRLPAGRALAGGLLAVALTLATFSLLTPETPYVGGVLPAMLLLGVGSTLVMVTGADVATRDVGADQGVAGSLVNSVQQVGAAIGTTLLALVAAATPEDGGARGDPADAALAGWGVAGAGGGAVLAVMAAAMVVVLPAPAGRSRTTLSPEDRGARPGPP